jgi:hypothetical protein
MIPAHNGAYSNFVDYVMQRCLSWGMTVLLMPPFMGLNDSRGSHSRFYRMRSFKAMQRFSATDIEAFRI